MKRSQFLHFKEYILERKKLTHDCRCSFSSVSLLMFMHWMIMRNT